MSTPADEGIAAARADAYEARQAAAREHAKATLRFLREALQDIDRQLSDGVDAETNNGVIGSICDTPAALRDMACDIESTVRQLRRAQ